MTGLHAQINTTLAATTITRTFGRPGKSDSPAQDAAPGAGRKGAWRMNISPEAAEAGRKTLWELFLKWVDSLPL